MTIDAGLALGASALLLLAAVAQGILLSSTRDRSAGFRDCPPWWGRIVLGARLGAAFLVAAALVSEAVSQGTWTPFDLMGDISQIALSLGLATLITHLALIGLNALDRAGRGLPRWVTPTELATDAGPAADLSSLALIVLAVAIAPGAPPVTCAQRVAPVALQWALFLLGGGSTLLAGSAGLMRTVGDLTPRFGLDLAIGQPDLDSLLRQAAALSLIAVGGGLIAGAYWSWRTLGTAGSGDPREGWMAVTWLIEAMSLLAWRLQKRPSGWAAALALFAAAIAIGALLAVAGLRTALWT